MKIRKLATVLSIVFACSAVGSVAIAQSPPPPPPKAHMHGEDGPPNPSKKPRDKKPGRADEGTGTGTRPTNAQPAPGTEVIPSDGTVSVVISGGFDTDPQDKGRPVVLIAAALGVPTEVFREAFRGVTPAGADSGPTSEQAQSNKAALLKVLAPYGITNDRLDEVSNYYRYNGSKGEVWQRRPAKASVIVTDGVVTGVTITDPGAGYTSQPTVTITGQDRTVTGEAELVYTNDFKTNGSIKAIAIHAADN